MADVSYAKVWEKRAALLERAAATDTLCIDEAVLPTGGGNIGYSQLQNIWTMFCVQGPVLPEMALKGKIDELVDKRNALAHGRETPSEIGARFSFAELETRYAACNSLSLHIVNTFTTYLLDRDFLI